MYKIIFLLGRRNIKPSYLIPDLCYLNLLFLFLFQIIVRLTQLNFDNLLPAPAEKERK